LNSSYNFKRLTGKKNVAEKNNSKKHAVENINGEIEQQADVMAKFHDVKRHFHEN